GVDGLRGAVWKEMGPLIGNVRSTADAARSAFRQGEKTLAMKEGASAEMAASFTETMKKASASLDQMHSTLGTYQALAEPSGNLGHDLTRTLGDLDAAARSMRSLTDYLELHPEAVLKGKQGPGRAISDCRRSSPARCPSRWRAAWEARGPRGSTRWSRSRSGTGRTRARPMRRWRSDRSSFPTTST